MTVYKTRLRFSLLFVITFFFVTDLLAVDTREDKRARKVEKRADRMFIQQGFSEAMDVYNYILENTHGLSNAYKVDLNIKMARLYISLQDYPSSIKHFEAVRQLEPNRLSVNDVCSYLDALRYVGETHKALLISRNYVYEDVYSKNQRYLNILQALTYQQNVGMRPGNEFDVRKLEVNTPNSEYWIGSFRDEFFYATSESKFHDPYKRFFHRTKFYSLDKKEDEDWESHEKRERSMGLLPSIPIDQQVGPVTFSRDNSKMFITEISYENKGRIEIKEDGITFYKTKIKFAEFNPKRRGWSSLKEAFPQIKEASYAHPFLFNNDRSLLFSSDLPGGYGGFDIYVCHWDDRAGAWGKPINLGPQINTEGDEICPFIHGDMLSFSSNGHVGFGGFDIYSVIYEKGGILPGSMVHWGSPVNTIYNDYGLRPLDNMEGYFISDRGRTKDDVYSYRRGGVSIEDNPLYGMNETDAIAMGAIGVLNIDSRTGKTTQKVDLSKFIQIPEEVITVYFDFDRHSLDAQAVNTLTDFINNYDFSDIESLYIVGYADEMGGQGYNEKLSAQRAESVANYLMRNKVSVPFEIVGKGQIRLSEEEIKEALEQLVWSSSDTSVINNVPYENTPEALRRNVSQDKRIQINRKARRVEIRATFK